ncbi:MAG TPA: hypothetical protein VM900_04480 [Sphingomonas sp.]|nr:hypothetical protein [Sphingomonas sp.]
MNQIDLNGQAQLVESIHQPLKASLGECLRRWRSLDDATRAQSYLVVQGERHDARRTLNARHIAELAALA